MIDRVARRLVPALASLLVAGCSAELTVEDPWVRAAPPGAAMTAGYLTLNNRANTPATLTGASSDSFDDVSLHETRVKNGISKMRHMDSVTIPGKGVIQFSPGGRHLMLMGPSHSMAVGDFVQITLHFADRDDVLIHAEILRASRP